MSAPREPASLTSPSPELELLLACARLRHDPAQVAHLHRLLAAGIDWIYLIRLALTQGLLPLAYARLAAHCPAAVPADTLAELKKYFDANAARNQTLITELQRLLDLFAHHRIHAVPFKGAILAATAYGDPALREFCDIDICLREQDIAHANDLLLANGYDWEHPLATPDEEEAFVAEENAFGFKRTDGTLVELHWRLFQRRYKIPFDVEPMLDRATPVRLAGRDVPSFTPEDLLVYLSSHAYKHRWRRLIWICDIAELLAANPQLNWQRVRDEAEAVRGQHRLALGLRLARDILSVPIPAPILHQLAAPECPPIVVLRPNTALSGRWWAIFRRLAAAVLFRHQFLYLENDARWQFYDRFWLRRSLRDHLLSLVRPNAKDRSFVTLRPRFAFLYYLVRPVRLLRDHLACKQH